MKKLNVAYIIDKRNYEIAFILAKKDYFKNNRKLTKQTLEYISDNKLNLQKIINQILLIK